MGKNWILLIIPIYAKVSVYYTTLKLVTVFSLDFAKLAQQHPTTKVRFQLIDIHQVQQAH
ncbi:hypothetical protein [bacterium endosymbiont of Bathymodiolus sp. 5 South]|uniref:hypothetical protein n=1 Tax=bacterium endosymbiont of Bathymodiolus sp. 5 South TaxID=1181670 RepID=UPI0010AEFAB5|nr:hypothetical protein [bacterium endosymbiont of Bathymodiolus sp. 5 South]CAC9460444.1 Low molecular weight protein tyrosine phosphatase (EC 3.1.3.48) [uncultured Gammaproteobacteria bacterium]SSC08477.1 Low molecular weight protein tyrosine phosphatase [bacterium endosymbiont of Bathymodiolus sp. 5 South]VVH55130.1 Low molecular weight protein tyrosine phosphatase (EC [uncultured Gammaproteobacteria bacterium]VVH63754.1 Low molecular weight protein tyrosine phosphatase (EC [uncultured Gamma